MANPRVTTVQAHQDRGDVAILRAAVAGQQQVPPQIVVVGGTEEKHEDAPTCPPHENQWIEWATIRRGASRRRNQFSRAGEPRPANAPLRCR